MKLSELARQNRIEQIRGRSTRLRWSQKVRIWNVQHGFVLSWVFWLLAALAVWRVWP